MYFYELLELIELEKRIVDGQEIKQIFLDKFGSGNIINMNKALRKLRENQRVCFKKEGRRFFYWSFSINEDVNFKKFIKSWKPHKD